tara:strand:+ start:606 stop:1466 length:861 start_codon:yes stop_codon:yes gene_type:complete
MNVKIKHLKKYIILWPQGGMNDSFTQILKLKQVAKRKNRQLIVDFTKNFLFEHFETFMELNDKDIIYKSDDIKNILNNNPSIFPSIINCENYGKAVSYWAPNNRQIQKYNDVSLGFNYNQTYHEDILLISRYGEGRGYPLFRNITYKDNIINHIREKLNNMTKVYDCVQVRNTDQKCNFRNLLKKIQSNNDIYIATDSEEALDFFKNNLKNKVFNFTKFSKKLNYPLHSKYSGNNSEIVLRDMITDIVLVALSRNLISNSKGGFIVLLKQLKNDQITINKLKNIFK